MNAMMSRIIENDQALFRALTEPLQGMSRRTRLVLKVISHCGDGHLWAALGLYLAFTRPLGWHAFGAAAVGVLGSLAAFKAIKNATRRVRPDMALAGEACGRLLVPVDLYSFPSGHASTSLAAAITLGAFFPTLLPLLLGLALCIAASRVALKVHYPLDILAGWALGGLMGALGLLIFI
jgi:undecaprenyl-diphosphatase